MHPVLLSVISLSSTQRRRRTSLSDDSRPRCCDNVLYHHHNHHNDNCPAKNEQLEDEGGKRVVMSPRTQVRTASDIPESFRYFCTTPTVVGVYPLSSASSHSSSTSSKMSPQRKPVSPTRASLFLYHFSFSTYAALLCFLFLLSSIPLPLTTAAAVSGDTLSINFPSSSLSSSSSSSLNRAQRATSDQHSHPQTSPPPPSNDADQVVINQLGVGSSSGDGGGNSPRSDGGGNQHQLKGNPKYNYYVTSTNKEKEKGHEAMTRYQVAKFDFEHVATPYIISMWIIIVGLAKIGFHVTPKLSSVCPESVVLMILGVVIGLIMYFAGIPEERLQPLTPNLFFLFMLPPIVMDAGYHMPNRLFFDNLVTILLYAVVGTIWNALAIGLSLYGCSKLGAFGEEIPFLDIMLFSSTVSAVDPVAVLAVFEEIHVNEVLYILVFGESLLNDAVTVVLYHMFEGYAEMAYHHGASSILPIDYFAGVASFFVVALGGTAMGVAWGFLAAFVSRFTHHVKIIEPIFVFVMAYLSYLSAEMFHLSGILSLTFCGITMKNYVEENITQKSHTTLKYAMKMLANSSEAIIFVFLGVCTVNDQHKWNTAFVTLTIIFCLVYRAIGVIGLTAITNRFRLHRVNRVEQFIMAYGGLRGAVAFALILIINRQIIHAREMFVTTIIAVVYFTVFLQGMTVGALVNILKVPRANKFEMSMNERIHTRLMDHVMAGLEDISGMMMGNYKMRDKFRYYNNRYLRKWLLRDSNEMGNSSRKIFETCSRLDLQDAMSLVSKQHLMYTTAMTAAIVPGLPTPNHLSVANRYLYTLDAAHLGGGGGGQANGLRNTKRGVDFVLHPPPPPHQNHARNFNYSLYHNNNNKSSYQNGGIANPMMMGSGGQRQRFGGENSSDSDEDFGRHGGGHHLASSGNNPPSIFLTVPQGPVGAMFGEGVPYAVGPQMIDPNASLTTLFRSYTQSNLSALNSATPMNHNAGGANVKGQSGQGAGGPLPAPSTNLDFNYDIGNLSYSPSLKDLADAELHHILNEAMFKPFKHVTHYTRSDYSEPPPVHPPFQHQVRMQIRRLISQSEKSRRHRGDSDPVDPVAAAAAKNNNNNNNGGGNNSRRQIENKKRNQTRSVHAKMVTHESGEVVGGERGNSIVIANKVAGAVDSEGKTSEGENKSSPARNSSEDDEGGITFTAKEHPTVQSNPNGHSPPAVDNEVFNGGKSSATPSTNTFNFPWRRESMMGGNGDQQGGMTTSTSSFGSPPASGTVSAAAAASGSLVSENSESVVRRNSSRTSTSSRSSSGSGGNNKNHRSAHPNKGNGVGGNHHNRHHHHHHKQSKLKEGVVRQREFPSWIENRDYVADYASPTSTLIDRINLLNEGGGGGGGQRTPTSDQQQHQVPSVYEIFHIDKSKSDSQISSSAPKKDTSSSTPPSSAPEQSPRQSLAARKRTDATHGISETVETTFPASGKKAHSKGGGGSDKDDVIIQFFSSSSEKGGGNSGSHRDHKRDDDDEEEHSIMISKL